MGILGFGDFFHDWFGDFGICFFFRDLFGDLGISGTFFTICSGDLCGIFCFTICLRFGDSFFHDLFGDLGICFSRDLFADLFGDLDDLGISSTICLGFWDLEIVVICLGIWGDLGICLLFSRFVWGFVFFS